MSGDTYTTTTIGGAVITQIDRPAPAVQSVATVTMCQARLALLQAGLLDDVEAAIAALPEPQRSEALITWEFKTHVSRDGPVLLLIAAELGLTSDEIDALFASAATF